jgi:alkyl hydroperoxide reductase subunit AhpC
VLGVSKDSLDSHNKFAAKFNLPYLLLSDPKSEVMKKYGAFGKKMMYGKEVQGTIRSTVVSDQTLADREEGRRASGGGLGISQTAKELGKLRAGRLISAGKFPAARWVEFKSVIPACF